MLGRRRGHTLSRRSILKSYKPPRQMCSGNALQLDGVADIRKAISLPIYAVGSCTVQVKFAAHVAAFLSDTVSLCESMVQNLGSLIAKCEIRV